MRKHPRSRFGFLIGVLALALPALSWAQEGIRDGKGRSFEQLIEEGWSQIAPGVLARDKGESEHEYIAAGVAGQEWFLQQAVNRYGSMLGEYKKYPSPEARRELDAIRKEIKFIRKTLQETRAAGTSAPADSDKVAGCDIAYGAHASAYPLSTGGAASTADAYFRNTCTTPTATVYARAIAQASQGSMATSPALQTESPQPGIDVHANASASASGTSSCSSSGEAWVYFNGAYQITATATNAQCLPPNPLHVTLTGPTYYLLPQFGCQTLTWNASATGGTPPYTFQWSSGATGSSYSKRYCNRAFETISVTGRDSAGGSETKSLSVLVDRDPTSGSCPGTQIVC